MNQIFRKLRNYNKKNYRLYIFCNFVAMLLMTSYVVMMFSPTVMNVLPKGGDSRKQAYGIFALVCVGSIMFTIYATALFYRMKTREMGVMLALGASRKMLKNALFKEVTLINLFSSAFGILMGIPFTAFLWKLFRFFVVDTEEMILSFEYSSLFISLIFAAVILLSSYICALPFLYRMNIMDVVNTEHKNEMIRPVARWCGWVGIVLTIGCGFISLMLPRWYMNALQEYPPAYLNL